MSGGSPRVLLLAAGYGRRLAPFTDEVPKCLMPINGRPLLGLWLDMMTRAGLSDITINTHYLAEQVTDWLDRAGWLDRVDLVHEPTLLGTGATLARLAQTGGADGPVMLVHADNLSLFAVPQFLNAHAQRREKVVMTMMTFATDNPKNCGVVELDSDGVVIGFHEKSQNPPSNLANAAVYILEPEVAALAHRLGRSGADFSTQIIPRLMGRIQTFHNGLYHRDIGSPDSLTVAQVEYPMAEERAAACGVAAPQAPPMRWLYQGTKLIAAMDAG